MTNTPSGGFERFAVFLAALAVFAAVIASPAHSPTTAATFTDCTSATDGTACDDGNVCTVGETCRAGKCLPLASFAQAAGSPIAVGTAPRSVAVGDVNRDGRLDAVVANYSSNDVTILLGNGSGGFSPAAGSPVAVGTLPVSVAVLDMSADGRLDIAVANYFSNDVTILLGNGLGGFSPSASSPVAVGSAPRYVVFGDANGDGAADLAVANLGSNDLTILLGNGLGGFSPAAGSPVAVGTQPASIAIGDVNGDARLDLGVANYGSDNVTILVGNGSGGFAPASGSPVAVGTGPASVAIGDVNGDLTLDLTVANFGSDNVTILLGNGSGGFSLAAGSPVAVGTSPLSVAIGDVNGDVRLDLSVANYFSNDVTILLGNGSGGFSPAAGSPVAVGTTPEAVVVFDLNADGRLDLAVVNSGADNVTILLNNTSVAPDGTTCDDGNACTVGETCRSGNCAAPVSLTQPAGSPVAVGTSPLSVSTGDMNGDGRLDLAVPNYVSDNVTILLGNGSGGFSPAAGSPVPVGSFPFSLAVGDLNGDGRLDLAVANVGSNNLTILLGNGSGGFSPAAGSPVPVGTSPYSVAIGDVNADGKLDLVALNLTSGNVTILLGNGSGGFSQAAGSPVAVGSSPISLALADVSGDGKLDLAVPNQGSNDVTILLGNGFGGFSQAAGSPVPAGSGPYSVAVGDLSGDGKPDLAVANVNSNDVTILLGNGSGGFIPAAGSPVAVGVGPRSVAVGDANEDGKLDLATANYSDNNVTILLGNGSGAFTPAAGSPIAAGTGSFSVATGDVNGDGKLDFAVANQSSNNVTILLGKTCPTSGCSAVSLTQSPGSPVGAGTGPFFVALADWNGDGKLDQAVANYGSGDVTILLGNGSGGSSQAAGSPVPVGTQPVSLASGDVNMDGKVDLAVANYVSGNVTILLGNGSGGFSQASGSPVTVGSGPRSVAIGDVNGDGKLDVVVANYFSDNVMILLGNGTGGFSQAAGSPITVGTSPDVVALGDVNRDGRLDVAVANFGTSDITILLGNGAGGFSPASGSPVAVGLAPDAIAIGDLNGDGKLDLVTANFFSDHVTILLGNGSGGFAQAAGSPMVVGSRPASIVVFDFNGDGRPDVATANNTSNNVTLLLGNGSGGFSQAAGSPFAVGQNPRSVAVGKMNGDGKLDLVVANFSTDNVTVLLNGTVAALNGSACDDGNACTAGDACGGGVCAGTVITAPPATQNLSVAADKATYSWSTAVFATRYDVVRGGTGAFPVGPGGGDEVCFDDLAVTTLVDSTIPALSSGFWYLSRGENTCGDGTYGTRSNGSQRITTTCP